jgi:hypothetical protein
LLLGRSLIAFLALVVVAIAGCGCGSPPQQSATIVGAINGSGGPAVPSHPHGTTFRRLSGQVIVRNAQGHTVASQRVPRGHEYRLQVVPGHFRLMLVTNSGQRVCRRGVAARSGQTTRANITCQIP